MNRLPHPLTGGLFDSPVPPGSGWPGDSADVATPVAMDDGDVARLADASAGVDDLSAQVSVCRACPRLVDWRERVAREKRASFADQPYWGRPVPGWGAVAPAVLVVGLAPAANGGNRTGRIFTGDRSGDWLFASLYRVGLAAQPVSAHAGDGQRLLRTRVIAAVRCAPPANKPSPLERDTCSRWLHAELRMVLPTLRAIVCLGAFGWVSAWAALPHVGVAVPRPRPGFGHGARVDVEYGDQPLAVLGCFHPSQQNTFTGKLTEPMIDAVLGEAAIVAGITVRGRDA